MPALAASRRNSPRTATPDHGRPRVGPSMMQNSGPTGSSTRALSPWPQLLPAQFVHPDLAAAAALAAADQDRSAPVVKIVLGQRQRFLNAQAGAPKNDDHRSQPPAVAVVGLVAHDRHDLIDRRWVGRVAHALVARWAAGVVAGQCRRRATPPRGVERW